MWFHGRTVNYCKDLLSLLFRADINACNRGTNWTALHCATFQGHGKVVMLLMNHNPDLLIRDNLGRYRTPICDHNKVLSDH